ncbi:hypothetical protein [Rubrobacter indicoceani]|nr:hypothetical protein [Rubrobacter indicoceani]
MQGIAFVLLISVMIFLFAFTFAVLGKGHYEPSSEEEGGFVVPVVTVNA